MSDDGWNYTNAVRQGMLAAADTIEMISKLVTKHDIPALVVDPVYSIAVFLSFNSN